jgi:hypothetical protein
LNELCGMLKTTESDIKKGTGNSRVMVIQNKLTFKRKGKSWKKKGKAKDKIPMPNQECFHCKEIGHWKRNCKLYLASLKNKGSKGTSTSGTLHVYNTNHIFLADTIINSWVFDTRSVALICNSIQGMIRSSVGDSPRGPLKQTGESPLKTHDKPKLSAPHLNTPSRARAAVAPTAHQGGPLKDPLEQAPPRSRVRASPRAGSARLEGVRLPRAGSASLEGLLRPRAGYASLEGAPHAHACSRTRALNALAMAGRRHHTPGARAPVLSHQLPRREPIPATVGDCAAWPVPVP